MRSHRPPAHILINCLSAKLGGGQTYVRNLLRHAPSAEDAKLFVLASDSLRLPNLPPNVVILKKRFPTENPALRLIWERLFMPSLMRRYKIDILFFPGGLLSIGSRQGAAMTAVTFQNMLPFDKEQRSKYGFGYRYLRDALLERGFIHSMQQADLTIFISNYAREFITSKWPEISETSTMIYHGVESRFFTPSVQADHNDDNYILYVSYIDFYKAQDVVVEAFARLENTDNLKLVLAGAGNPVYVKQLKRQITQLNLSDRVVFAGNVPTDKLVRLYQQAKFSVFASFTENCPNIVLEMMASGRPSLISNRGPMPELAQSAVSYFDPADKSQLLEMMTKLINAETAMEHQALRARKRAMEFSWKDTARRTWKSLLSLKKR